MSLESDNVDAELLGKDDLKLLDLVKKFPALYKKELNAKEMETISYNPSSSWESISQEMQWSVSRCRKRFSFLKNGYYRAQSHKWKRSKYTKELFSFLDPSSIKKNSETKKLKVEKEVKPSNLISQDMIDEILKSRNESGDGNKDIQHEAISKSIVKNVFKSAFEQYAISSDEEIMSEIKSLEVQSNTIIDIKKYSSSDSFGLEETRICVLKKQENVEINNSIDILETNKINDNDPDTNRVLRKNDCKNSPPSTVNTLLESTIREKIIAEGNDPSDVKIFFRKISEYVSTKYSLEKQKELRLAIGTMLADEEFNKLTEDINSLDDFY